MRLILIICMLFITVCSYKQSRSNDLKRKVKNYFNKLYSKYQGYTVRRSRFERRYKQPKLFEGDIVWDKRLETEIQLMKDGFNVLNDAANDGEWSDGIVPYKFTPGFDPKLKKLVKEAMEEYHKATCIRFKEHTYGLARTAQGYIEFFRGRGCYSYVGHRGNNDKQPISLGNGCERKGIIIHELMHALGFYHEQSRLDRDKYIRVLEDNIKDGMENQFQKYQPHEASTRGFPYDLISIMHYPKFAFSKNGKPTIQVLNPLFKGKIGQREKLSDIDIQQLNDYYNCPTKTNTGGGSGNGGGKIATTTTTTTTRKTIRVIPNGNCGDKYTDLCFKYRGSCKYSRLVRKNCASTCRSCDCKDKLTHCTVNDCHKRIYSDYLCQKTCRNCIKA